MTYTLIDVGRLVVAVVATVPVLVLPGAAIAAVFDLLGYRAAEASRRPAIALLAAFTLLPAVLSLVMRAVGPDAALFVVLALGAAGLLSIFRGCRWQAPGGRPVVALAGWLMLVAAMWVDIDWAGGLYRSALAVDTVKHAATIQVLANSGLPMPDPFFARPEPVSYYYFFYLPGALALKLGGGLTDSRAAMGALVFFSGPALVALIHVVAERSRLVDARAGLWIGVALLLVTGLDILPLLLAGLTVGIWYPSMDWWNEQISGWVASLLWVPHHLAGLFACWVGFLAVADGLAARDAGLRRVVLMIVAAGLAFASALGSSVWVTLGGAATGTVWLLLLAGERRWRDAGLLAGAGIAGVAFAAPFIAELLANRAFDGAPVGVTIRAFAMWDAVQPPGAARYIGRALLLPLNYALEFGAFIAGSILFWRSRRRAGAHPTEVARLLTIGAIVSLVIATGLKSKVIGNDLGWRIPLFAQLSMLVWTWAWLAEWRARSVGEGAPAARRSFSPIFASLLIVGFASTIYGILALRLYVVPRFHSVTDLGVDPKLDRAVRDAYEWLNARAPATAVTQHDPSPKRAFDFGLYGRHVVGVADKDGSLFGAARADVRSRMHAFAPVFGGSADAETVRAIATRNRVDFLVVSSAEPAWRNRESWLWRVEPAYASDAVRVVAVTSLAGGRP